MEIKSYPFSAKVLLILEELNKKEKGFLVGGSLRDIFLGKEPKDFDFASSLDYPELKETFKNYPCIEVGKSFGVLRVQLEGEWFEIAKFRRDLDSDGRRPKSVVFVDKIEEDLERRDFTINAMAYNKEMGLLDLYGAREDLVKKKIRFIGRAEERIEEDGLRIMRAFRFISQLGFTLEERTREAIILKKAVLTKISKIRITEEWNKLLEGDFVRLALEEMKDTGVLEWLFPEIKEMYGFNQKTLYHKYDLWEHTLRVVSYTGKDISTRLAALLHDIAKPRTKIEDKEGHCHFYQHEKVGAEMLATILKRNLEEPNKIVERVKFLIENHMVFRKDSGKKQIKKYISKYGYKDVERLIDLSIADDKGKGKEEMSEKEALKEMYARMITEEKIPSIHDLDINGFHLMELGLLRQEIQAMKEYLLEKVLNDEIQNDYESLFLEAKRKKEEQRV